VRGLILPTATIYLMPVLLLFSLFLLLRGHNEPGGGFAGGLVAASAFVLLSVASGVSVARRALQTDPRSLVGVGLTLMILSGLIAPLLFDIGVYLGVAGTILLIVFSLEEEDA